ncbi:MAG: cytochrome-c oxidase, cbb3-type subunit III [Robiginitomaculum sp.]|nr:cytochrome-c oxidase, cbb3-type subunit III [Robiginitomaculum sp.]
MSADNEEHGKFIDEHSGEESTGHEWDGIAELNTPMPRWWLGIMYASIIWSIIYVILMPGIPLLNGYTKGTLGFSDRARVTKAVEKMHAERSVFSQKLIGANLETIQSDPDLLRFAMAQGKSLFGDNCETCHGASGRGFPGYPNLNDDIWLWGGSYADIRQTINYGIRADHDDTRLSLMAAYGRDEIFSRTEIGALTDYVINLSTPSDKPNTLGTTLFAENCTSCHGDLGKGTRENGAPDLTDQDWLYGGRRETIQATIFNGRKGLMPNWNERLSQDQIAALSVYVHSLGGGE